MTPKEIISKWIELFNAHNAEELAELYHDDAIMYQMVYEPMKGKNAIRKMLSAGFKMTKMKSIPKNLIETEEWIVLEWEDPVGVNGCGVFQIIDGKIKLQRGYWDNLTFMRQHNLPLPTK